MEFDYFYNTWIREHACTDLRTLYGLKVYLDKDGKIKGILWLDKCSGGFNCPYQRISLDVKDLHDCHTEWYELHDPKKFDGHIMVRVIPSSEATELQAYASASEFESESDEEK